jgi:hypothetical protein
VYYGNKLDPGVGRETCICEFRSQNVSSCKACRSNMQGFEIHCTSFVYLHQVIKLIEEVNASCSSLCLVHKWCKIGHGVHSKDTSFVCFHTIVCNKTCIHYQTYCVSFLTSLRSHLCNALFNFSQFIYLCHNM